MSRALPCVATSVGGIPELLDSGDLVPPGDVPALANKLSQVLSDPPRMAQMSQRNLAVAANYSKEVLQARRLEFFRHLRQGTEVWLRQQRREETGKQP
jgi:glycosyltransferase involved in cell wall biosynthesis